MTRRLHLGHWFEGLGFRLVMGLFGLLAIDRASNLGGWMARNIGPFLSAHKTADKNLARAMPHMTAKERGTVLRGMWDNLGRVAAEYPHLAKIDIHGPDPRLIIEGRAILDDLAQKNKAALFFSGHYGNWEVLMAGLAQLGFDAVHVYRRANTKAVDDKIQSMRQAVGGEAAPKGKEGARLLITALNKGRPIAMLMDQKMSDGVAASFFGLPAMTAPAIAEFALRSGRPILPARAIRLGPGRFKVVVEEPLFFTVTGDKTDDVRRILTMVNERIESWVRERPDHWFWVHRRWGK